MIYSYNTYRETEAIGIRGCAQGHIVTKKLKRDEVPLGLALKLVFLYKAASESVSSNYILIIHILTISSHNDVMRFGP